MPTLTGTVTFVNPVTLLAGPTLSGPLRTPAPAPNQRTGTVRMVSPASLLVLVTNPLRRAPGDLGYGNAIITGSVFGGGVFAPRGGETNVGYYAGANYAGGFCTQRVDTGIAANADVAPTLTVKKNGVVVSGSWLTLTHPPIATGEYVMTGTIPSSYAIGDTITITAQATVNGVGGKQEPESLVLGSPPPTAGLVFP